MLSIVEGPVAVGTVWLRDFTHLKQVGAKQTVSRQELSQVEDHITLFTE